MFVVSAINLTLAIDGLRCRNFGNNSGKSVKRLKCKDDKREKILELELRGLIQREVQTCLPSSFISGFTWGVALSLKVSIGILIMTYMKNIF